MLSRSIYSLRKSFRFSPISFLMLRTIPRFQSTDATESVTPVNEKEEKEFEYKFPEVTLKFNEVFNEDLYKKLPLDLNISKQIATDLLHYVRTDDKIQSELDKISKLPNEFPVVYDKFSKLLDLMRRARKKFVDNNKITGKGRLMNGVDVDADQKLRSYLGRWSRRDEDLAKTLRELYSYLAKKVFSVDVEHLLSDARCCGIHITAHKEAQAIICSDPEIVKANLQNPLLPPEYTKEVFRLETELLTKEEQQLTKFQKKRTTIEKEIEKFKDGEKAETLLWETNKDEWKKLTDLSTEETIDENDVHARFPRRLSTVEGWICYKFQAMDVIYRFG